MFRRTTFLVLSLLIAAASCGCVYYNTFYHARAAYREAEQLRRQRPPGSEPGAGEIELLNRTVEKSGRVVKLHPDSKWADDALLLMGSALYYQGKHETATERLNELLSLYPDSELADEAEYLKGAVLLAKGNPVLSEDALERLAYAEPPGSLSDDALTLIGQARHERGKLEEAAEAYSKALEIASSRDQRVTIRFLAAENYSAMEQHDLAAEQYEAVLDEGVPQALAFDARLELSEARLMLGEGDVALEVLEAAEHRTQARDDLDSVLLMRGRTYESMGDFDRAIETYESITASHSKTDASAEAQYRRGMIYRNQLDRFDDAVEAFQLAKQESPRSEYGKMADESARDIARLKELLAVVARWEAKPERERVVAAPARGDATLASGPATTASGSSAVASDSLRATAVDVIEGAVPGSPRAEPVDGAVATTQADEPDRLAHAPGAGTPEHPVSTPSEMAEGGIADSLGAGSADQTDVAAVDSLQTSPPDLANVAAVDSLSTGSIDAPLDSLLARSETGTEQSQPVVPAVSDEAREAAEARLRLSEIYLFGLDDPETALLHYARVVEDHPESELAPKAALAIGWVLENRLADLDSAIGAYEAVIRGFPGTRYATAASRALENLGSAQGVPDGASP